MFRERRERERQTKILPSVKEYTNANRFSSLEESENEFSCENCTSAHTSNAQCQQWVDERGGACTANKSSLKQSAHQVSYLAVSGGDRKGVHHVGGSGWRRLSAIMDSGSAECVAPQDIARNTPLMETESSRQGQTYHTADGGVIKNKGEKIVTMYSERCDQFRARYQITDVSRPLNSVNRFCDQGNNVLFTQTGWIINHETG